MKLTKIKLKRIIKEELGLVFVNEEAGEVLLMEGDREILNEVPIPGLGYFLRSYRWINIMLKILVDGWLWKYIPERAQPAIITLAETSQSFVDAMDTLYNEHPNIYKAVMGPIMAVDPGGTATGKAKEVVLQQIYDKMMAEEQALIGVGEEGE